jgi:hypothetical protein
VGGVYAFGSYVIVYITPERSELEIMSTIIHESVHVWQAAMKFIGEEAHGDEAEAYNIEQIAMTLIKDFYALSDKR